MEIKLTIKINEGSDGTTVTDCRVEGVKTLYDICCATNLLESIHSKLEGLITQKYEATLLQCQQMAEPYKKNLLKSIILEQLQNETDNRNH